MIAFQVQFQPNVDWSESINRPAGILVRRGKHCLHECLYKLGESPFHNALSHGVHQVQLQRETFQFIEWKTWRRCVLTTNMYPQSAQLKACLCSTDGAVRVLRSFRGYFSKFSESLWIWTKPRQTEQYHWEVFGAKEPMVQIVRRLDEDDSTQSFKNVRKFRRASQCEVVRNQKHLYDVSSPVHREKQKN